MSFFSFIVHLILFTPFGERELSAHSINYFGNFFISFSSADLRRLALRTVLRQRTVLLLHYKSNALPLGFEPRPYSLTGRRATINTKVECCRLGRNCTLIFGFEDRFPVCWKTNRLLGRLDSNQNSRIQSPLSYRLDDPPIFNELSV